MSVILIIRSVDNHKAEVVSAVRACVRLGIADILDKIGKNKPIFCKRLFDDIHDPGFPLRLIALMENLNNMKTDYSIYEIESDESYEEGKQYYELNIERLNNIINSRKKGVSMRWG